MIRHGSARLRGTRLALLLVGVAGVVIVGLVVRANGPGLPTDGGASGVPPSPSASASGSAAPSDSGVATGRPLPSGLDDRAWVAELGSQRWAAGSLSGKTLVLPKDEIGLVAGSGIVVSVRYRARGATSTVLIRDIATGRLRWSMDRTETVTSAVATGTAVYVAGDTSLSGPPDGGVQAIALSDGTVRDLIPPGPAPADATGPVTRSQLRISASGQTLGSGLCSGERCSIDIIDLATGLRTTPIRGHVGFLAAVSERVLYTVNETSTQLQALDTQSGSLLWRIDDAQVGAMYPTSDGSRLVLAYMPGLSRGGPFTFTVVSADASGGALQRLLERPADSGLSLFAGLSNDRFAVIGPSGTLGEPLASPGASVALTLVDTASGTTQADAVTLIAP